MRTSFVNEFSVNAQVLRHGSRPSANDSEVPVKMSNDILRIFGYIGRGVAVFNIMLLLASVLVAVAHVVTAVFT